MDLAGGIAAGQRAQGRVVTIAVDKMKFIRPVHVGDVLCVYTKSSASATSSMEIKLVCWALRHRYGIGKRSPRRFSRWSPSMTRQAAPSAQRALNVITAAAGRRGPQTAPHRPHKCSHWPKGATVLVSGDPLIWVNRRLWRGSPPYTRMVFMRASTQSSAVDCQISAAVWSAASASWYLINSAACPASALETKNPPSVARGGLAHEKNRFVAGQPLLSVSPAASLFAETTLPGQAGWRGRQPFS
jgi:hypothetical protein